MQELDKRIGLLRLLLADITARESQGAEMSKQYRLQLHRIVEATVSQAGDLATALAAMAEVEERLGAVEQLGRHLGLVRARAAAELEALLLTRQVAEAQAQLADLEARRQVLADQLAALPAPQTVGGRAGAGDATTEDGDAAQLRARHDEVVQEIARLHRLILDASDRAARTLNPGT